MSRRLLTLILFVLPLALGLSGCGGRGRWIGRLFQEFSDYKVVAVHDYFRDRAHQAARDIEVQGVGHGAHSTRRCMASRAGGAVELRPWPACVSRGWNVLPAYQREASWLASTPACTATCCMSSADGRTVTTGMSTTRTACWATK